MRKLRKAVDAGLPILGTVIVFAAVVFLYANLTLQIIVVMFGLLMIDAGIWKLTHPLLPNERRYKGLRGEVDHFITLVRRMNAAAVDLKDGDTASAQTKLRDSVEALHESVRKMEHLAGKTDEELTGVGAHR